MSARRDRDSRRVENSESNERYILCSESTLIFLPNVRVPVRVHMSVYAFAEILKISFHTNVHVPALVLVSTLGVTLGAPERYTESNYRRGCEIDFRLAINRRRKPVAGGESVCSRFFHGYLETSGGGKS